MATVTNLAPLAPNSNPLDSSRGGLATALGTNVEILAANHPDRHCTHLIVCERSTGERIKITFSPTPADQTYPERDYLVKFDEYLGMHPYHQGGFVAIEGQKPDSELKGLSNPYAVGNQQWHLWEKGFRTAVSGDELD